LRQYGADKTSKDVYDDIGGEVQTYYFYDPKSQTEANSCALRLSRALNKSGYDIDRTLMPNGFYVKGADNKDYLLRVSDMVKYLTIAFGAPDIVKTRMNNIDIQQSDFTQQGIIGFKVKGWDDATGHVTLYSGTKTAYGSYFQTDLNAEGEPDKKTVKVMLWILK